MKKGRYISIQTIEEKSTSYAIFKARLDVDRIITSCGYSPIVFGSRSPIGFFRVLKRYYDIISLKFRIKHNDVVFFQFPWIHSNKDAFYSFLFRNNAKVRCIIHDLDSLRCDDNGEKAIELNVLKQCDSIIAHTQAMKNWLVENGIDAARIKILHVFPYLTDDPIHSVTNLRNATIIFAGNMMKSKFVNHLYEITGSGLRFHIYGNNADDLETNENVVYKGSFSPNNPGVINGNWGLVWDGDELDTCSGAYGEYLRYNSSHKIALYLSLGIPVILWSESSLARFVVENNLGIVVNSLNGLANTLKNLSEEKERLILKSIVDFAAVLRKGDIIRSLIVSDTQTI